MPETTRTYVTPEVYTVNIDLSQYQTYYLTQNASSTTITSVDSEGTVYVDHGSQWTFYPLEEEEKEPEKEFDGPTLEEEFFARKGKDAGT